MNDTALLLLEKNALREAQVEVERATNALVENISRAGAPKSWAARVRFQQAMGNLQVAEARLHFRETTLANKRHLRVA